MKLFDSWMQASNAGLTATGTAGELIRNHGKVMIVHQRVLHLYGVNFTETRHRA